MKQSIGSRGSIAKGLFAFVASFFVTFGLIILLIMWIAGKL